MRDDDEHAKFERPRRHTRPRTKVRPNYDDADLARVITIDRGRYTVTLEQDGRTLTAMKSRNLGRKGVIVGDEVKVVGDVTGDDGSLARIVEVSPRRTMLRRTADDDDPIERVIVANADQLVIVAALADPPPRAGLIDRCLVAAFDAGMEPLVCLTKSDLGSPDELLALLAPLGVRVVVTRSDGDLDSVRDALRDRTSVLVGHSGVGKSTLVNALVPDANRSVSYVNAVTGRGRHTSTSAISLELPFGGWIIDTPGIRSFGLAHVQIDNLIKAFPDLQDVTRDCPRGCLHSATEPECALDVAVAEGALPAERVESFRRILASMNHKDDH
ncbi:ribosome small subunit-dependent GTPase A [Aeromicrobium sp.]|uniref:ribosome small subunit-dependent GTPase A n=1 Tax=Aeromicrobium sp. TaxID=1871063 RepID=UPI0019BBF4DF|nr:ribosome small subunit-dependent GTPase A [Aeromicrobium sp.]MBC7629928.1 ribosome small subunit-dependent GTPase A [Aeromicrobium sp.]